MRVEDFSSLSCATSLAATSGSQIKSVCDSCVNFAHSYCSQHIAFCQYQTNLIIEHIRFRMGKVSTLIQSFPLEPFRIHTSIGAYTFIDAMHFHTFVPQGVAKKIHLLSSCWKTDLDHHRRKGDVFRLKAYKHIPYKHTYRMVFLCLLY